MNDYIKELLATIHMRDFYIRNLKTELGKYPFVAQGWIDDTGAPQVAMRELVAIVNEVPWEMTTESWQNRRYIERAKFNQ